jgi:hypothetical protein
MSSKPEKYNPEKWGTGHKQQELDVIHEMRKQPPKMGIVVTEGELFGMSVKHGQQWTQALLQLIVNCISKTCSNLLDFLSSPFLGGSSENLPITEQHISAACSSANGNLGRILLTIIIVEVFTWGCIPISKWLISHI